jgi:hypothetical protein
MWHGSGVEALRLILLYIHLIGFALLLGAAITQYVVKPIRINRPMLWGSLLVLLAGIALAAPIRDGDEPSPVKLGFKLLIALAIAIMVWVPRKRAEVNRGHFLAIIGLTLVNAAIAVFWR